HHPHLHSFPTRRSSDLKATTNEAKRTECFTSLASLATPPETRTEFKKVLQNLDLYEGESKEGEFVRAALNDIKQKEDQKVEPAPDRKSTRLNSSHVKIS